ncbi:MAG: tetratricopeptide repeat protein [Saprospiraceae bacterium]|nr:tetratricopeptide repeat protein [Saprospiraceae bacterium]
MNLKSPTITQVWSNQPCLRITAWCLFVFFTVPGQGQTNHGLLKKADQSYIKQDFTKAEENYRKALEQKSTETTKYNLGNAIMEQNRPDEAVTFYEDATKKQNDQSLKSKAWHNLGNALYLKKEYENSIKAYKESLKISPDDLDTKKNLVLAKKQLLKQQQQQQNQDPPKDQNNQDQQQQPSSGEDQKGQQEQKKESPSQPQQMSKEEAEQLLQYTEREDQKVQAKLRNKESKTAKPKKDW